MRSGNGYLWILLAAVLGGGFSFAGTTRLLLTPMYESTTTMLVLTSETTLSSLSELQLGTQLTNDYEILTTSRAVLGHGHREPGSGSGIRTAE